METKEFKKVAVKAALKAGLYINKNVGRVKQVRYKGEINVVTNVDKKAEDIIVSEIRKKFPRHAFIAEEKDYGAKKQGSGYHEFKWIIDPLDGTTNFLHGLPVFSVSIALEYRGKILLGVVYDPTRDELFYAEKNKGAFLNKKRINVSKIRALKKALLVTGFAYNIKNTGDDNIENFAKFLKLSQAVRRLGSAAIDLCYVACGRFDGFWELNLAPWDTPAGLLMVKEAGGKVTKFDGSKHSIYGKEILATNSKIHSSMVKILSGK